MENASKALLMAGGILITMIVVTVFYFMFGHLSEMVDITEEDSYQTEVLEFNRPFEAYNKKLMYGSDIISVLNMAIDSNSKNNATVDNENNEYYVNIVIEFKNNLGMREEKYKYDEMNHRYEKVKLSDNGITGKLFRKNTLYDLTNNRDKLEKVLIDAVSYTDLEDENKTYDNKESSVTSYKPGCKEYTVTFYPAAEFKTRVFYCSGMKFNKKNGRVNEMKFTEKT